MKFLAGHLLVAIPQLPDENFFRSVVLMVQHDENGAFGLILNRKLGVSIRDVWSQIADGPCDIDTLLHSGGPVEGPLMALHTVADLADIPVTQDAYITSDKDRINELVQSKASPLMLFLGYSGWGSGQLESELAVGGWLTAPVRYEQIFSPPEELWKSVADEIGRDILFPGRGVKGQHGDPELN